MLLLHLFLCFVEASDLICPVVPIGEVARSSEPSNEDPLNIKKLGSLVNAVNCQDFNRVKFLIDNGVDIEEKGLTGETSLFYSMLRDDLEIFRFLLSKNANMEVRGRNQNTCLLLAAKCTRVEMVKLLLEKGADIHVKDNTNDGVIFYSVIGQSAELLEIFLSMGVDDFLDNRGNTPLMFAYPDCARLLLATGRIDIEAQNDKGLTALMCGAQCNVPESIHLLVDSGANIEAADEYGTNALIHAATSGATKAVEALLDRGANIEAKNLSNRTALMLAAMHSRLDTLKFLISKGARVDIIDTLNCSALILCSVEKYPDFMVAEILLSKKKDMIDIVNVHGHTALTYALKRCKCNEYNRKFAIFLLSKGANVHTKSEDGDALLFASLAGDLEITKLLVAKSANLNVRCPKTGRTPLMNAILSGDSNVIDFLLKAGADPYIVDNKGQNAYQLASAKDGRRLANMEHYWNMRNREARSAFSKLDIPLVSNFLEYMGLC